MCTRVPESSMEHLAEAAFQQLAPPRSTSDRSDFPAPEHNSWHADWPQNRDRSKPFLVRQRLRQLARKWSGRPLLHYQRNGASLRLVRRCDRRHRDRPSASERHRSSDVTNTRSANSARQPSECTQSGGVQSHERNRRGSDQWPRQPLDEVRLPLDLRAARPAGR